MIAYTWLSRATPPPPSAVGHLNFPGGTSGSTDGRILLSRLSSNAVDIGGGEFTFEMWIRPSSTSGNNGQTTPSDGATYVSNATDGNIIVDGDGFNTGRGFIIGLGTGRLYLGIVNFPSGRTEVGTTDLRDGAWHHIAVYRDATSGLMELFVDGNREGSVTGPTGSIAHASGSASPTTDGQIVFGVEKLNAGWGFNGDISEIRISNNRRYNGATYTVPTAAFTSDGNTLWLAHLNEGSGTTVTDSSSSGINGSLDGSSGPTWGTADPFGGS